MKTPKKSELIDFLKDIKQRIVNKSMADCSCDEDWAIHYENMLNNIENDIDRLLGL